MASLEQNNFASPLKTPPLFPSSKSYYFHYFARKQGKSCLGFAVILPSLAWRNLFLICSREAYYHKSWVYSGIGLLERKAWKICKPHLTPFLPISSLRQLSKEAHHLLEGNKAAEGEAVEGNEEERQMNLSRVIPVQFYDKSPRFGYKRG